MAKTADDTKLFKLKCMTCKKMMESIAELEAHNLQGGCQNPQGAPAPKKTTRARTQKERKLTAER